MSCEFPFILIGNSTLAFSSGQSWDLLNSWYTDRGPEHRLRLCLADFTNRSFIACATQARRRLAVECHTQLTAANISTIPKYTARFTPIPRSLIWSGKMVIYAIVTNYVYSEFWKRYHYMDHCEWNHCFFLFSWLFFFSLSFLFLGQVWCWSFLGLRNLPFDAFSLKWLQISLGWSSKNQRDSQSFHRYPELNMYYFLSKAWSRFVFTDTSIICYSCCLSWDFSTQFFICAKKPVRIFQRM